MELLLLIKDCSRMSVPSHLVGLAVMICGGMNRKRIQSRAWPYFTFLFTSRSFKNYYSSAWEPWQWLPLSAEGVCELRWRPYRIWLCFPKMKFTKKKKLLIQLRLISSVSIWLSWPHREEEDWQFWKFTSKRSIHLIPLLYSFPSLLLFELA